MKTKAKKIAVAGATGMVGQAFLRLLENKFLDAEIVLLASKNSKGKKVNFRKRDYVIEDLAEYDFSDTDLALFQLEPLSLKYLLQKQFLKGVLL